MDDLVRVIEQLTDAAIGRRPAATPVRLIDRDEIERELASIRANADVDTMPTPRGSMPAIKRVVLRFGEFNWVRQRAVNRSTERALTLLAGVVTDLRDELDRSTRSQAAALASVLARREEEVTLPRAEIRSRRESPASPRRAGIHSSGATEADAVMDDLYQRFEHTFRPDDAELRDRLAEYVPDLQHLAETGFAVVDVGCGRGDLIQVLTEHGIRATGIDSSPSAIGEARDRGLDVVLGDAIDKLESMPAMSVGAVTVLHVVEHLPTAVVLQLLDAAYRALAPGGILILETPNPTNLIVGASAFYNDPTHVRPVPPAYLQFAVSDRGFVDVACRFLHPAAGFQPSVAPAADPPPLDDQIEWALRGPQDYAVIARRPPDQ